MRKIFLTQGMFAIVDDDDFGRLNSQRWCADKRNTKYKTEFVARNGQTLMHRVIMKAKEGEEVDHINGNSLDNRKSNLRIVTRRQNAQNRHDNRTSRFPGVSWNKGKNKWECRIRINGHKKHVGYFKNEEKAAQAYLKELNKVNEEVVNMERPTNRKDKEKFVNEQLDAVTDSIEFFKDKLGDKASK